MPSPFRQGILLSPALGPLDLDVPEPCRHDVRTRDDVAYSGVRDERTSIVEVDPIDHLLDGSLDVVARLRVVVYVLNSNEVL